MASRRRDKDEEDVAEEYARFLHNKWGVGAECSPGKSTGLLYFLSVDDRAMYLSRGKALEPVLTNRRLDKILDKAKPHLRNQYYVKALMAVLDEIELYLERGEPSEAERRAAFLENLLPFSILAGILGVFFIKNRHDQSQARAYAQVESHLSELDRGRAEALQGRYRCTSCPICFEDFQTPAEPGDQPKTGSDGQPLKLLRCGHVFDETCWSEWVSSGQGNVRRCPICNQDVGGGGTNETTQQAPPPPQQQQNQQQRDQERDDRMMRQFHRERNFRLHRMARRYPTYVRDEQIRHWTSSTYDGTLARDPSFVRSNPQSQHGTRSNQSGYRSSSGFGGGTSGGGRGGSW